MEELKHIAAWVKEQYVEGYVLTWLLTQPGLWWCDGEVYQAALFQDGDRLKSYVQKNEQSEILQGISEKVGRDENWEEIAASLTRIFEVYQQELNKLQDAHRIREVLQRQSGIEKSPPKSWTSLERQNPLSDSYPDPLTGSEK